MKSLTARLSRTPTHPIGFNRQFVVVGANDIGIHLAEALGKKNQNVVLIDEREELLQELNEEVDVMSLAGHPLAIETLQVAGVGKGARLIAVTESDEMNLLLLFLGEQLGMTEGFALVHDQEHYESFIPRVSRAKGKLHLINYWELVAGEIERRGHIRTRILYADRSRKGILAAAEFLPRHPLIGERTNGLKLGNRGKVLQVLRKGTLLSPDEAGRLEAGNLVIFSIDQEEQDRALRRWFPYENQHKVMVGGARLMTSLKSHWPHFFRDMVCIERDLITCQQMLKISGHALVLKGDGLDISLLKEARIEEAGVFLAASQHDEVNLLSSLLARSFGVKDVLTILRKRQHTAMLERLSLDGIISIPELVVEDFMARLMPSRADSALMRLRIQIGPEMLEGGFHLVYRAGLMLPLNGNQVRENEDIITVLHS